MNNFHNEHAISTANKILIPTLSQELSGSITATEERSSRRREKTIAIERLGNETCEAFG
jgi:hypothetical protein